MKPFHFKQFSIHQDQCAMKVTLDACLLGALCASKITQAKSINHTLDIGCGTGLLSLMLAQTGLSHIDAVELDPMAAKQAICNVEDSPFKSQIKVINQNIKSIESPYKFDLIISNPPFFSDHLKGPDAKRNQARHNDSLSFSDLNQVIHNQLSPNGMAWILLPYDEFEGFRQSALEKHLKILNISWVKSQQYKKAHRVIFTLQHENAVNPQTKPLESCIQVSDHGTNEYTPEFKALLSEYYLKL